MYETSIEFKNYQFIDSCELTRNYKWQVPRYVIRFDWNQPEESIIGDYCFEVALDPEGNLIEQIGLGNGVTEGKDVSILTVTEFKEIWQKAQGEGMNSYELGYDSTRSKIVIELARIKNFGNSDVLTPDVVKVIDAFTGEELR